MNEQIKELEKQAWEYVDQTWDWANPDNPSKETLFKTKFAELIVRECAKVSIGNDPSFLDASALEDGARRMFKHFGVK